jgi:hypothetical protein
MTLRIAIAVTGLAILTLAPGYAQDRPLPKEDKAAAVANVVANNDAKNGAAPEKAQPLTEQEQSDLTKRAEEPGKEVAGGALSNLHLTYIVIALAAAVVVLVLK